MKFGLGFLTVALMASTAFANLGPFSLTDGSGNSVALTDSTNPSKPVLELAPPSVILGSGNVLYSNLHTQDSPKVFAQRAGYTINVTDVDGGTGSHTFGKTTIQYVAAENVIRIFNEAVTHNGSTTGGDQMIEITNIDFTGPAGGSTKPNDFMTTASSVFRFYDGGFSSGNIKFSIANTVIPEPSAFLLGGLVLGMVGIRKRFFSKKDNA